MTKVCTKHKRELDMLNFINNVNRPKDGSDISEELKNKILNQRI